MAYPKSDILHNFDVFPKVLVKDKPAHIRIRPLGGRTVIRPDTEYDLYYCWVDGGEPDDFPLQSDFRLERVKSDAEGGLTLEHTFDKEGEYFLRVMKNPDEGKGRLIQFPVYCVDADLAGRWPLIGDLHMHTTCSDGNQIPEVVCANYRRYGYDFMVVSDHNRYYPSLRAIKSFSGVKTELVIVPGEEVHMPWVHGKGNACHIVNFGGEYSVNALVDGPQLREVGDGLEYRAIRENDVPGTMTEEEFYQAMTKLAEEIDVPEGVDRYPAAVCKWVFDHIRSGNGLGIFPHPNWRPNVNNVAEAFTDWIFDAHVCDAFEVLGGENYYNHNGYQTARYYREMAKGNRMPVVGSTDSHSSYESNRNAFICATIVFSPANERTALIDSIKNYYSVAVDTISKEYRLVGEERFIRYGCFLIENYFPLHDELCAEEGRLMKQYAVGTDDEKEEAKRTLAAIYGRVQACREKYFDF